MKKLTSIYIILVFILLGFGCQKENILDELPLQDIYTSVPDGMMILGGKIDNPYSVENMKKAYESLKNDDQLKSLVVDDFSIETSHYYIRILPKDSDEVNWLVNDTTMELFDYPLDYEIIQEGNFYQDSLIPFGNPTWLYTSVPVEFELPKMNVEILEECYIPDYDTPGLKSVKHCDFLKTLEYEAFKITGNVDTEKKSLQQAMAKAVPSGKFRVHNTSNGALEGVRRVKVRVHRVVKWDTDQTDDYGNYQMDKSFTYDPHYAIIFENTNGFKIWGNWAFLAPANYNMGYHDNTGFDKDFWQSSIGWPWCTVNNAVCEHRDFCDALSIARPPVDMRVWYLETSNDSWSGAAPMLRRTYGTYGFDTHSEVADFFLNNNAIAIGVNEIVDLVSFCLPDMFIMFDKDHTYKTNTLKALLYHESSHASHYTKVGNSFWVKYINYIITNFGYGDGTGANAWYCGYGEMWGNYFGNYLCSNYNLGTTNGKNWYHDRIWFNPGFLYHVDAISDVQTYEILDALTGATISINELKTDLKSKTSYDSQVDNAYNWYPDWP